MQSTAFNMEKGACICDNYEKKCCGSYSNSFEAVVPRALAILASVSIFVDAGRLPSISWMCL